MNTTSVVFNVDRSLELSPPNYPKGVHFVKRIVTKRDKSDWSQKYQPRSNILKEDNVANIRISYQENGFLENEPVQVVTPSVTSEKEFEGVGGFNRDTAQGILGWESTIVDIVKFDTPLIRRIYAYESNHVFNPRAKNVKADILHGIKEAVKSGEISQSSDVEIKDFIARAAADFSASERTTIFNTYRSGNSKFANLQPYNAPLANEAAKNLDLQYGGKLNMSVQGTAYIKDSGNSKTLFYDGLKKNIEHGENVTVYGYVKDPEPTNLFDKRMTWLRQFRDLQVFHKNVVKNNSADNDFERVIFFGGFLPQDITPTGANSDPKESGLVDVNGRAWNEDSAKTMSAFIDRALDVNTLQEAAE
tara:strand:+ start:183 stop:1265 length:1083 start_codon:yes stop_codon:yes gene_type:complete